MKIERDKIAENVAEHLAEKFILHIQDIAPGFDPIISAELAIGNQISAVSKGWPNEGSVVVEFKDPLQKDHPRPKGIFFEMPNDPKGWAYQYSNFNYTNENVVHMLISGASSA